MFNPKVKVGDRIVSIHMDGENTSVPIGTKGTIAGLSETPFGKNIQVDWDNGSKLDLLDDVDVWMLEKDIKKKTIEEEVKIEPSDKSIKEDLKRMVLQNIIK
jgi:hypothetical protein